MAGLGLYRLVPGLMLVLSWHYLVLGSKVIFLLQLNWGSPQAFVLLRGQVHWWLYGILGITMGHCGSCWGDMGRWVLSGLVGSVPVRAS